MSRTHPGDLPAALVIILLLAIGAPSLARMPLPPPDDPVRGVIISTHTSGWEWGSNAMPGTLRDIRELGANWIATHPYAAIRHDGAVHFSRFDPTQPPADLVRPITDGHSLGLRVLIKPHLAYWGSGFAWRGAIGFETPAEWARFWRDYERWIVTTASACDDADAFVIGTELRLMVGFETEWRRLIAAVRAVTDIPITYAANWDTYQDIAFWDALDAIGIQAYFPISEAETPTDSDLERGWQDRMTELRVFAETYRKPIVFTELGYNRSLAAAARPWEYSTDGQVAEELQERCLRIALEAIEQEPAVIGAFLWKWFPNPRPVGRNFQLATPRLKETIAGVWRPENSVPD